jgi:hypothetical protein
MTRAAIPLLVALLQGGAVLVGTSPGSGRAGMVVELSPFEDNLYAQLLMRAVTGSIYPTDTFPDHYVSPDFPKQVNLVHWPSTESFGRSIDPLLKMRLGVACLRDRFTCVTISSNPTAVRFRQAQVWA